MKKHLLALTALLTLSQTALVGQTNWTGAVDSALDTPGNWDNGLPSSSNLGIIGTGDTAQTASGTTYSGYYIELQTGGQITGTGLSNATLSNGQLTINGGSVSATRGLSYAGGSAVTLNTGTYNMSDANVQLSGAGTSFTVEGGAVNGPTNRSFWVESGTTLSINGGAIGSSGAYIGGITGRTNFGGTAGTVNFGGGDTYATNLGGGFGGGEVITYNVTGASGSVNAVNFSNTKTLINWATGAGMSMTITGSATWAEDEYNAGRLTFNGDDNTDLGLTWAEVTSGGTQIWDYTGNTLTLAAVPEAATFALLAGLFGFSWIMLRRRS